MAARIVGGCHSLHAVCEAVEAICLAWRGLVEKLVVRIFIAIRVVNF